MAKPIVALMYDFDKTLSPKNMQDYGFMKGLDVTSEEFWAACTKLTKAHQMDSILSYMYMMLEKGHGKYMLKRESFRELGKSVKLFPGVQTWFERINKYCETKGLKCEHYIISSGLKEIIEGTPIAGEFKEIYAAEFLYDEDAEKRFLSSLRNAFEDCRNGFRQSGIRCHGRLPEIVAWLEIGMAMLLLFLEECGMLSTDRVNVLRQGFSSLLYAMARQQAQNIEQDKPALIFVRKLSSLIESGQVSILKKDEAPGFPPKDFIGYEDDTFYYLFNDAAHRAVRKLCDEQGELFTISSRSLPKALAEEGLLDTAEGENTRSVRFRSGTKRVICLYKEKVKHVVDGGMR